MNGLSPQLQHSEEAQLAAFLDLLGLAPGRLVIFAAALGRGRTAFAVDLARRMATGPRPRPAAYFSLDESKDALTRRLLRVEAGEARSWQQGSLDDKIKALLPAAQRLSAAPLWIDDDPGISVRSLTLRCAKWRRELAADGLRPGLVVLDSLQGMFLGRGAWGRLTFSQTAAICGGLKKLAVRLDAPVLALSKLNGSGRLRVGGAQPADISCGAAVSRLADTVLLRDHWVPAWDPTRDAGRRCDAELLIYDQGQTEPRRIKLYDNRPSEDAPAQDQALTFA